MIVWIIKKKYRMTDVGYAGPSCERAGVEPGKQYSSYEEAQADADKLTAVNPVGFEVVEI